MTPELPEGTTDVVLALPDLQGRLQGVRLAAPFYREQVADHGYGACRYLVGADVDMVAVPGFDPAGYGDFLLRPDPATMRPVPWQEGTALVIADVCDEAVPVAVAPRQVLKEQIARLDRLGLRALVGTELEFLVFGESYREAHERGYAGLRPATRFNVDYALTGLGEVEAVVRDIVRGMSAAGLAVESARAECHPGQYEIVFRYGGALEACDGHVFYKTGAKQIAEAGGHALTFMAKYDSGEGNSCHLHLSLRDERDRPAFAEGELLDWFVAGQLACMPEFALLFAPTINSYKRLQPGGFAPDSAGWGRDDRTRAIRVIGSGDSLRIEHRVGGGDANPYLAVAGVIAAGLYGIERRLSPAAGRALPRDLASAIELWTSSDAARKAFGDEFVDHYANAARAELAAFAATVTDWERHRAFERL